MLLRNRVSLTTMLTIVLIIGAGHIVQAQDYYDNYTESEEPHYQISDQKLALFISAQRAVEDIQERFRKAAENPDRAAEIEATQRTMTEEIIRTIKAHALTVDEYNKILGAVQQSGSDASERYSEMIGDNK